MGMSDFSTMEPVTALTQGDWMIHKIYRNGRWRIYHVHTKGWEQCLESFATGPTCCFCGMEPPEHIGAFTEWLNWR